VTLPPQPTQEPFQPPEPVQPPDPFQPPPPAATYAPPQPYAAYPGYASPANPAAYPATPASTNGSATVAFILALLGLVLTPVVDIAAVIVGHYALATIRRTGEPGAGLAKAALAIGYSLIGIGTLVVAFAVAAVSGSIAQ